MNGHLPTAHQRWNMEHISALGRKWDKAMWEMELWRKSDWGWRRKVWRGMLRSWQQVLEKYKMNISRKKYVRKTVILCHKMEKKFVIICRKIFLERILKYFMQWKELITLSFQENTTESIKESLDVTYVGTKMLVE